MSGFAGLTAEDRAANLVKAKAARERNAAERKASPLRRDYPEDEWWLEMATAHGIKRLAPYGVACTLARQRSFIRRLGYTSAGWLDVTGEKLGEFPGLNPMTPERAWEGFCLEALSYHGL